MSYLVLARKWRPQTFADLIGQEHVAHALANAIAQDRVAHTFLFTGVRGVGKTTSARLLAKALCCVNGPTVTPCNACGPCKDITAGIDVDVQEIDAASNTGVNDVRHLQEYLPYRPARNRYKILIVDEVHMLSINAWNAFLKTLEEPPAHVKFIFATTDVHKVPVTILSRSQRYDFKLISTRQIAERVRYILSQEQIVADDDAVQLVAREATGSMRDALSLLDQVIAFGGKGLKGAEVARALGLADRAALQELSSAVVLARPADALRSIDQLAKNGFDLLHVAKDLLQRFRHLVVAAVTKSGELLAELADSERLDVESLAKQSTEEDLSRLFQGMSRALDDIQNSPIPRHALEVTLVRLACRPALVPIDRLLERLAEMERRLGPRGGPSPQSGNSTPSAPSAPSAPRSGAQSGFSSSAPSSASGPSVQPRSAPPAPPSSRGEFKPSDRPSASTPVSPVNSNSASATARSPSSFPAPMAAAPSVSKSIVPPSRPQGAAKPDVPRTDISTGLSPQRLRPPSLTSPLGAMGPSATSAAIARPSGAQEPTHSWIIQSSTVIHQPEHLLSAENVAKARAVIARIRAVKMQWGSLIEHGVITRIDTEAFEVAYERRNFLAAQLNDRAVGDAIVAAVREELGCEARIVFCEQTPKGTSLAVLAQRERVAALDEKRRQAALHPLVQSMIELLGAEITSIKIPGEDR